MGKVPAEEALTCPTCTALQHELHLVERALERSQAWCEELREARNVAEERVRRQDAVLAQLYSDRTDDRRLLDQQAEWLAVYVTRMLAAEDEAARLRPPIKPPRRRRKHKKG